MKNGIKRMFERTAASGLEMDCLKGSSGSRYFEELKDGYGYVLKEGKLTKAKLLWQTEENDE